MRLGFADNRLSGGGKWRSGRRGGLKAPPATILRIPGRRHGYIARRADQERLGGTSKRVSMPARDNRLIAFLISGRGI